MRNDLAYPPPPTMKAMRKQSQTQKKKTFGMHTMVPAKKHVVFTRESLAHAIQCLVSGEAAVEAKEGFAAAVAVARLDIVMGNLVLAEVALRM